MQSGSDQTYTDRINAHPSYTLVMERPEFQSINNGVNAQQTIFRFTPVVQRSRRQNLNNGMTVHQPIIAYSSTLPSTVSQINMTRNENRVIGNVVNAAQPIFLSGEEVYQGQLMFTAIEEVISHEPLLYTGPKTGIQFLNDCRMLPQFINGSEVPHQQEFMNNTVQGSEPLVYREETRVQQEPYNETQGAEVDINRDRECRKHLHYKDV